MALKSLRVQEYKVVMTKLSRDDFIQLQKHCELKNESVNSILKKAIIAEIDTPIPHMIAGKNLFFYNKARDNFSWRVMLDNGLRVDIEDNLSAECVSQLFDSLRIAVDERDTYIKKETKEAVAIPSKLLRRGL